MMTAEAATNICKYQLTPMGPMHWCLMPICPLHGTQSWTSSKQSAIRHWL